LIVNSSIFYFSSSNFVWFAAFIDSKKLAFCH
jgi:hypothetical protein